MAIPDRVRAPGGHGARGRVHGADWAPDLEAVQALPHDLVLVASRETADRLAARGFRAYCLTWRDPDSVFTTLDLLGDVMDATPRAAALKAAFTANLDRVAKATADIPPDKRVKAIYIRAGTMMIPMDYAPLTVLFSAIRAFLPVSLRR